MRTDTAELPFPWFQPEIRTTRYVGLGARIRRSPFVQDLKRGYRRSVTVLGAVAIAYGAILVLRGAYVVAYAFGVTGR